MAEAKNEVIRIGRTTFNSLALGNMTATEFEKTYKGKLGYDIKEAKKQLRKYFKK